MAQPAIESEEDREKSKQVGALRELWPFLRPYKLLLAAAGVALVTTAMISPSTRTKQ